MKEDEPAILGLGEAWQVPVAFHSAEELDAVPVSAPSEKVREKVGTASVCEAACLLSAGYGSIPQPALYAPKSAFGDITLALARLPHLPVPKSGQGEIVVAGLGSGAPGHITPDVDTALRRCDTVAGYSHYVDFIRDRIAGKPVIQNGMKGEVERCLSALEAALDGQNVCMVCSGDPGILAMAGLLYELRTREPRFRDIPIRGPGRDHRGNYRCVLAWRAAPERLLSGEPVRSAGPGGRGAPQHPFCSPIPAAGGAVQPRRRKRRDLLEETLAVFREHRGEDVLVRLRQKRGQGAGNQMGGQAVRVPRRRGRHVHAHHYRRPPDPP